MAIEVASRWDLGKKGGGKISTDFCQPKRHKNQDYSLKLQSILSDFVAQKNNLLTKQP